MIKGFHWLNYEGGKFSTSRRRGIFTDAALEELPADLWRWWLIANAPETSDTDFTVSRFAADVNKDLADVFGNLVNRLVRFAAQAFDGRVPGGASRRARARAGSRDRPARRATADASRSAGVPPRRRGDARDLGARQRLCAGDGALDRDQFRSRARRGQHANRAEPGAAVGGACLEYRADARRAGSCPLSARTRRFRLGPRRPEAISCRTSSRTGPSDPSGRWSPSSTRPTSPACRGASPAWRRRRASAAARPDHIVAGVYSINRGR